AAAADIDQQIGTALEPERVARRVEYVLRLLGARDNLDLEASFAPNPLDEAGAIVLLAYRAGCDCANPIHPPHPRQTRDVLERTNRQIHRLACKFAAGERITPQPHHLLDSIDDLEMAVAPHVRDYHVDGVGTDIDRGQAHDHSVCRRLA